MKFDLLEEKSPWKSSNESICANEYKIPWDDPDFSKRMLIEHLSQEHDLASRNFVEIDEHVDFIKSILPQGQGKVLDLGCGPGLYLSRLASDKISATGVDFSPASIQYAKENASEHETYFLENVLTFEPQDNYYDLVMMLFGEINAFKEEHANLIMTKAYNALKPGGRLLLEVMNYDTVENISKMDKTWDVQSSGLFSDKPHIIVNRKIWLEEFNTIIERFLVIEEDGNMNLYECHHKAYFEGELEKTLFKVGFSKIERKNWPGTPGEVSRQFSLLICEK